MSVSRLLGLVLVVLRLVRELELVVGLVVEVVWSSPHPIASHWTRRNVAEEEEEEEEEEEGRRADDGLSPARSGKHCRQGLGLVRGG